MQWICIGVKRVSNHNTKRGCGILDWYGSMTFESSPCVALRFSWLERLVQSSSLFGCKFQRGVAYFKELG